MTAGAGPGRPPASPDGAGPDEADDGRGESPNERLDRNWVEILQELRVTQTGTQILTGFLLAIAFQPAFADLQDYQQRIYLVLVVIAVLTTALGLAPVSLHRALFRRRVKVLVVEVGHVVLRVVLLGVGLVLVGTVLLVFDVVAGLDVAVVVAVATATVIATIGVLPGLLLRRAERRGPRDRHRG